MILDLQATPAEVMRAVEAVQEFARNQGLEERDIFGLGLAVEECASNIIHYAYRDDAQQTFQVKLEKVGTALRLELRDHGPEFDPTGHASHAVAEDEDRVPGGWGIPLVRHYVDEIRYRREGGENVLQLTRSLVQERRP